MAQELLLLHHTEGMASWWIKSRLAYSCWLSRVVSPVGWVNAWLVAGLCSGKRAPSSKEMLNRKIGDTDQGVHVEWGQQTLQLWRSPHSFYPNRLSEQTCKTQENLFAHSSRSLSGRIRLLKQLEIQRYHQQYQLCLCLWCYASISACFRAFSPPKCSNLGNMLQTHCIPSQKRWKCHICQHILLSNPSRLEGWGHESTS